MITPKESVRNLQKLLDPNRGRLVAVSLSPDGRYFRLFAGMGGRSVGSKNRWYQEIADLNGNGPYIRTAVHNPAIQVGDPSATLYVAQRSWNGWHVASNGEQTEGIAIALAVDSSFEAGQKLYRNEGEKNGHTARITAAVHEAQDHVLLGKIVSKPEKPEDSTYHVWAAGPGEELSLNPGEGWMTVTYDGQGGLGPNREDPWGVLLRGSLEDNMNMMWRNWDPNTRANLVGKEIERGSGRFTYSFRSIHQGRGKQ